MPQVGGVAGRGRSELGVRMVETHLGGPPQPPPRERELLTRYGITHTSPRELETSQTSHNVLDDRKWRGITALVQQLPGLRWHDKNTVKGKSATRQNPISSKITKNIHERPTNNDWNKRERRLGRSQGAGGSKTILAGRKVVPEAKKNRAKIAAKSGRKEEDPKRCLDLRYELDDRVHKWASKCLVGGKTGDVVRTKCSKS